MSEELKPCPFCGAEAKIEESQFTAVYCKTSWEHPYTCGGRTGLFPSKEMAVAAWNRRAKSEREALMERIVEDARENLVVLIHCDALELAQVKGPHWDYIIQSMSEKLNALDEWEKGRC